ncbi:MAG: alpha/beta fold hydrolase [Nocardioidaceae bacterium]
MTNTDNPLLARRTVDSRGVRLAMWEGSRSGPTVIFVHGFPDTHILWEGVIRRLTTDFHCVAYDVRGAGQSEVPRGRDNYRLAYLIDDLVSVIDTVSPDRPIHLVGHDWGSIQGWDAVVRERSDPRLTGRIASYTSISGPCLDHVRALVMAAWRGGRTRKREAFAQARRSWYVLAFQVPVIPELVLRRINRRLIRTRQRGTYPFADTLPEDAAHGVNLYRANMGSHRPDVHGGPYTDLPVQLIVPLRDAYVTPVFYRDIDRFVPDLVRVDLDAGHWVPRTHPDEVANRVADFVRSQEGRRP